MSNLMQRLTLKFSRSAQSRKIAQVCALSLREVGLNVGGNVFEIKNSKGKTGWLVSLQMPERVLVPAVDALAIRIFLTRRVEAAMGLKPKSFHLLLSFGTEARRLPFSESVVEPKWLQAHIAQFMAPSQTPAGVTAGKAAPARAVAAKAAPAVVPAPQRSVPAPKQTASPVTTTTRGGIVTRRIGVPPVARPGVAPASLATAVPAATPVPAATAPVKSKEEQIESLLGSFDDDGVYEVNEGSMTDFDRAMN